MQERNQGKKEIVKISSVEESLWTTHISEWIDRLYKCYTSFYFKKNLPQKYETSTPVKIDLPCLSCPTNSVESINRQDDCMDYYCNQNQSLYFGCENSTSILSDRIFKCQLATYPNERSFQNVLECFYVFQHLHELWLYGNVWKVWMLCVSEYTEVTLNTFMHK